MWDFYGEKKQREIDSLIINDEAKLLSDDERAKVIYSLHSGYEYTDYTDFKVYFYTTNSKDASFLQSKLEKIWEEIQKKQEFVPNKILVGMSASRPFFGCFVDDNLKKEFSLQTINAIQEMDYGQFLMDEWNSKEHYYLLSNLKNEVIRNIEFYKFKQKNPIYVSIFSNLYSRPSDLMWNHSSMLAFSWIFLAFAIPILIIVTLVLLNRSLETKTKKILIAWSFLNYLLPFLGYLVQLFLIAKVIKLLRKKGNYLEKIKIINEKSYFGYLKDFFSGKGGGGSYSYSSSGSSYSSRSSYSSGSSGSYSSSSGSSSSRSFGGGGGGRSGGGGSSGKW